jgi:hypothetical protein
MDRALSQREAASRTLNDQGPDDKTVFWQFNNNVRFASATWLFSSIDRSIELAQMFAPVSLSMSCCDIPKLQ